MTGQSSRHPMSMRAYPPGGRRLWLAAPAGYRSPGSRSAGTQAALAVLCVTSLLLAVNLETTMPVATGALDPDDPLAVSGPLAAQALVGALLLQLAALLAATAMFTLWVRRIFRNLSMLVEQSISPGRATVWCLAPVLNLVLLPRLLSSVRSTNGTLFYAWWLLFSIAELTLFGLAGAAIVTDAFFATSPEIVWESVLGGRALAGSAWPGTLAIANALLVALGAAMTITLVRTTTREHEIGESAVV